MDHFKQSRGLTRRECEVLDHLIAGSSSKAIARKLGISPRTIEDHRARILQKAGVKTTAQLSIMALKDRAAAFGRRTVH
ncbi:LuxR C-terminal-related transcriptional regulator [Bradyrhizobium symbiodeficiens]|uniref:LuxR C-terminal-related transcriptional regulator n=1 Tax=Bradyrhizobium symbiodeficiens TaxID=1404367 RepID=UPI003A5CB485